jgi:hypothetical protein
LLCTAILLLACTVVAIWKEIGALCLLHEESSSEVDMGDALAKASSQPSTSDSVG